MKAYELARALDLARKLIRPSIAASELEIFALIADAGRDGIDQATLIVRGNSTRATVARHVADLSILTAKGEKGPDLVTNQPDPNNRRGRLVRLTAKGERVAAELLGAKA